MITTDARLSGLAAELDGGLIARREFLRKSAVLTGGTAAGLAALRGMAPAQPKAKLRIWLFKSYVTAGNDILAKQVEAWAKERNVEPEFDWATFGDREQKFVAAIEAGNPPDVAEMNYHTRWSSSATSSSARCRSASPRSSPAMSTAGAISWPARCSPPCRSSGFTPISSATWWKASPPGA